ncbi:glycosyltransferase family 4 protein [Thermodesulfobacteriota bacterium]
MKVCIVSDGLPFHHGGAQLRAYRHARYLQTNKGVNTILIAWDRIEQPVPANSFVGNVFPVRLRFHRSGEKTKFVQIKDLFLHLFDISCRLGFLLFKLRYKYDVIHVINAATWFNLMAVPLAKLIRKPVILEMVLRGADDPIKLNERSHNKRKQIFPHRPLKYSLFLLADAYVSKFPALSATYYEAKLPKSKLFQIHSAVDIDTYSPPTTLEKKNLRQELGLGINKTIILFVGLIIARKGVHQLLEAFNQVNTDHPQAHLLIVGPNSPSEMEYFQEILRQIEAWKLSEKVTLVNRQVTNVESYLKAADIFVLPTHREGFSVAILEAMSTALAIVTSDIPEIALSQITDLEEGLLIPVGDINRLADSIRELLRDPELRTRLGLAARERVIQEFTYEIVYDQYLRLYEHVLKQNKL